MKEEEDTTQEELSALLEEAHMPLHSLLAKYGASNPSKDAEGTYTWSVKFKVQEHCIFLMNWKQYYHANDQSQLTL